MCPRKSLGWIIAGVLSFCLTIQNAFAWEAGYLVGTFPGITMGLPSGSNPPPGIYYFNFTNYGSDTFTGHGTSGPVGGSLGERNTRVDLAQEVPVFVWSTPWTIAGATWSMMLVQPLIASHFTTPDGANNSTANGPHNLILNPFNLSWQLTPGFFTAIGLDIIVPTGKISGSTGLANWGQPFTTIEPRVSFTYGGDGWNLTGSFRFGINTENRYTKITDAAYLHTDITATKKFGPLEFGPIAYEINQIGSDRNCRSMPAGYCASGIDIAVGGLIGYDFGPVTLKLAVTDSVYTRNFAGGWRIYSQLLVPLWLDSAPFKSPDPLMTN